MQKSQEIPKHSNKTGLLTEVPSEGAMRQLQKMGFLRYRFMDGTVGIGCAWGKEEEESWSLKLVFAEGLLTWSLP